MVIVGGGFAGAAVAKVIAETGGKRILILEAGRATGMSADKYASHVTAFQESLVNEPNTPYPNNPNAPQAEVGDIRQITPDSALDTGGYLVQKGPLPFQSDFTRALGGTSLHWLGTCLRMLPNDFKLRSLYGQGVDWPLEYEDLRPYYERAEWDIIGVAGAVDGQHYPDVDNTEYFGHTYDYPMERIPASYLDTQLERQAGRSAEKQHHHGAWQQIPGADEQHPRGPQLGAPQGLHTGRGTRQSAARPALRGQHQLHPDLPGPSQVHRAEDALRAPTAASGRRPAPPALRHPVRGDDPHPGRRDEGRARRARSGQRDHLSDATRTRRPSRPARCRPRGARCTSWPPTPSRTPRCCWHRKRPTPAGWSAAT